MSDKMEFSLEQAQELKPKLEARKEQLLAIKNKNAKAFTETMRTELDNIIVNLALVDEVLESAPAEKAEIEPAKPEEESVSEKSAYEVPKGSENVVHARICKGRRFNPNTGVEESKSYVQLFTLGEWQLFQQFHKAQGYHIEKVLYNPFEK